MSDEKKPSKPSTDGKPLSEGYVPTEKRGYVPQQPVQQNVPKPPPGGTGESGNKSGGTEKK